MGLYFFNLEEVTPWRSDSCCGSAPFLPGGVSVNCLPVFLGKVNHRWLIDLNLIWHDCVCLTMTHCVLIYISQDVQCTVENSAERFHYTLVSCLEGVIVACCLWALLYFMCLQPGRWSGLQGGIDCRYKAGVFVDSYCVSGFPFTVFLFQFYFIWKNNPSWKDPVDISCKRLLLAFLTKLIVCILKAKQTHEIHFLHHIMFAKLIFLTSLNPVLYWTSCFLTQPPSSLPLLTHYSHL